jgi:four helix bundle protein
MDRDLAQRTKQFALRVIKMFTALPKTDVARVLGRQALRAGTSIGANYREASRARSKAEFVSKTGDCLREAEEAEYWLELLVDSGAVRLEKMAALLAEARELIAILTVINNRSKQ